MVLPPHSWTTDEMSEVSNGPRMAGLVLESLQGGCRSSAGMLWFGSRDTPAAGRDQSHWNHTQIHSALWVTGGVSKNLSGNPSRAGLGRAGPGCGSAAGDPHRDLPTHMGKGRGTFQTSALPITLAGKTLHNWKITVMAVAFEVSVIPDFYLFHWDLQISIFNALIE